MDGLLGVAGIIMKITMKWIIPSFPTFSTSKSYGGSTNGRTFKWMVYDGKAHENEKNGNHHIILYVYGFGFPGDLQLYNLRFPLCLHM